MATINIVPNDLVELENFFSSQEIPKKIILFGAITYYDVPRFVTDNLALLKSGELTGQTASLRYNDLLDLRKAIEERAGEKKKT
ncbi:MAG TPA: hypothetical protein PLS00_00315 [Niabella sp.]|jgi:hypothetical protein|nr:hypothetical protein [Niabella sp.]